MGSQAQADGVLSATILEACRLRVAMKADGATEAELDAAMERTIRQCWPFTREWHFRCRECEDHGLQMRDCPGDSTCGRHKPHLAHDFGQPCWCAKGAAFTKKLHPQTDDDFTKATKVKQPTRFGR